MAGPAATVGQSDFDFLIGSWRVHNRRLRSRLTGADDWEEFEAEWTFRPVLGGAGTVGEFRPRWPGHEGFLGMSLRLFNPETGLWSIYWADNVAHALFPPLVGRFQDGVGEFYGDDSHESRPVRVRFRWSAITPNRARWEQAFSADDGASWETNWIMTFSRHDAGEFGDGGDEARHEEGDDGGFARTWSCPGDLRARVARRHAVGAAAAAGDLQVVPGPPRG